ncbi:ATP-grasp domain-containing protein [Actinophytocola sp.]|uniref:ATP-grasp domain-containing protein n=1 Tax=Actinophytocola sp. TaxID=1872138 RepID=UPI0025C5FF52|nr:ATP-grasp domain-containing protein [Actinophytocola sp.]
MSHTLVVLGGSDHTAGTYQRAAKLGYRTIAVDPRPSVELADEYLTISTRAPERIAAALPDRSDIVGVLCPGNDVGLAARAFLTRHWKLADRLPESAVVPSVDKAEFRRVCTRLGLPGYGWASGRPGPDVLDQARHLRYPAVVKPVDGSGSRGVAPCAGPAGLPRAFTEALAHSPTGRVLVEEFVGGTPLTVEALVLAGAVIFHAVSERTLTPPPFFVTSSHLLPAALPPEADAALVDTLTAVCAEIGYRRGPLTVDAVLGHDGLLYPIDLSVRTGGNGLPEAIESAYGVDVAGAAVAFAAGEDVPCEPRPPRPTLVRLLSSDRAGTMTGIEGAAEVRAMPEVIDLQLFTEPGSRVEPFERADRKLGQVVFSGGSVATLRAAESAVRATLRFRLAEQDLPVPLP